MKIVVCIKQVPDTKGGVKFNPDGTIALFESGGGICRL